MDVLEQPRKLAISNEPKLTIGLHYDLCFDLSIVLLLMLLLTLDKYGRTIETLRATIFTKSHTKVSACSMF